MNPEDTSLLLVRCLTPEPPPPPPPQPPYTGLLPLFLSTPQLCRFPPIWLENKQRPTRLAVCRPLLCCVHVWVPLCMRMCGLCMCAHMRMYMPLCMCVHRSCVCVCAVHVCPRARVCIVLCACMRAWVLVCVYTVHVCTRARVCVRACVRGVQARGGGPPAREGI